MTDHDSAVNQREQLARKRLRVRQLTDPLGAMGFRQPRARREREARVRRFTFIAAISAFFGAFGAIVLGAGRPLDGPAAQPLETQNRVVRQYVVRDANGDTTLVRILAPPTAVDPPKPHVRTRSS